MIQSWYWQNYLILKGQEVTNPDAGTVYSNSAAREQMNEENIFGAQGMAIRIPVYNITPERIVKAVRKVSYKTIFCY